MHHFIPSGTAYLLSAGLFVLILNSARSAPTIEDYIDFSADETTRSYSVVLDTMSTTTALNLQEWFNTNGIGPSTIIEDGEASVTIALGCFPTIMEAHIVNRFFKSREQGRFLSLRRAPHCKFSSYCNPTTSPITMPSLTEFELRHFTEVSEALGTTVTSKLTLQQALETKVLGNSAETKQNFEYLCATALTLADKNPLKIFLISELARLEIAEFGHVSILKKTRDAFLGGTFATSPKDYFRTLFLYADQFHEFEQDSVMAGILYRHILMSDKSNLRPTRGQRMRAVTELTALSRELVGKQVGTYHDAAYWWSVYKKEGFPLSSKAAAVINLILIENYKSDNVAAINLDPVTRQTFIQKCNKFHVEFPHYKRERLFMYNLQVGIFITSGMEEEALQASKEAHSLYPLGSLEQSQWAGQHHPVLSGLLLAVHKFCLRRGSKENADMVLQLLSEIDAKEEKALLEPHLIFESF